LRARGGRPRGDLRRLLVQVFSQTAEALTWRDAAGRLVAGGHVLSLGASELQAIRRTVDNMANAGELQRVGHVRCAANRPMTTYRLPAADGPAVPLAPWQMLSLAMRPDSTK
jgi:predicted DNA repair protein MutK